ncbi:MAG: FAD-dependent oxidoreductase [Saprospiraceae bacterium]|nr:FAD-dependent oxidoreductase [Saprospiraceae bacterium]
MNRLKNLNRLNTEEFDVCIIGGGATGTGCALDAVLRGLKVILIEKDDFGGATSSRSTKLFHGGVRYLEQAVKRLDMEQFRMVNKALQERRTLIKNAPHLAQPLALLTPCYSWFEGFYYNIGLKIYDFLAGKTNLAPSDWLSKEDSLKRITQLKGDGLSSSVLYFDGQFDDARYTLALAKTASEKEAVMLNHVEALEFGQNTEGVLNSLKVRDVQANQEMTIRAKVFINATGPFSDAIRLIANPKAAKRMRVSKGVHLVLPRELLGGDTAILIPKTDDGRVIFIIPWQRRLLVGTTDEECALTEKDIPLEQDDVDYLLKYVNRYISQTVTKDQVRSGFGGLRPLLQADPTADSKSLVRDHEVEICKKTGLVSIMGGKWTTYRLMAKDTVDTIEKILRGSASDCKTAEQLLMGAENWEHDSYKLMARRYAVPEYVTRRLNRCYGSEVHKILALCWKDGTLRQAILPGSPILKCEIVHACVEEMACTLRDVCARRIGLELTDWALTLESLEPIALVMQEVLWFSSEERVRMVAEYREEILGFMQTAGMDKL